MCCLWFWYQGDGGFGEFWALLYLRVRWLQLCSSLSILWHCLSLGLKWKHENWSFPVLWPLLTVPNLLAYWVQHFHSITFFGLFVWYDITETQIKITYELVNTNCVINTQKEIYLFKVQLFNLVNFQKVVKIFNLIHRIWEPISTCSLKSLL